jgi:hypothetical protein
LQGACARFLAPDTWRVCIPSITDAESGPCARALAGACVEQTAVLGLDVQQVAGPYILHHNPPRIVLALGQTTLDCTLARTRGEGAK